MNVRALFAVCAVAVLGAVSATTPARADEWNKSYEVGATPEVAIHTDDGHVRVVVGDSRHVEVHAHHLNQGPDSS